MTLAWSSPQEPMGEQERTRRFNVIFQNTRQDLDLDVEATDYEFPVGLRGLCFDLLREGDILEPLGKIREKVMDRLADHAGSRPMLVHVKGGDPPGVCLAQPHSFDRRLCSAAVIPMSNPNRAPVRVSIAELMPVR